MWPFKKRNYKREAETWRKKFSRLKASFEGVNQACELLEESLSSALKKLDEKTRLENTKYQDGYSKGLAVAYEVVYERAEVEALPGEEPGNGPKASLRRLRTREFNRFENMVKAEEMRDGK